MSADVFLDSNVVLYTLDLRDGRRAIALDLVAKGAVVSTQVLSETANVARRKLRFGYPSIRAVLEEVCRTCQVAPVTVETVRLALQVGERYGFSYYDALIVAAARLAGCRVLYSEDLQHGQVIEDRLAILNPFASAER
jgi:predicted nucleic acid-binding protein